MESIYLFILNPEGLLEKEVTMARAKSDEISERISCPVGRFFSELEKVSRKKSGFLEHLTRSRVEFLKAVKSLIDDKIEALEKKGIPRGGKKATKIKVE